MGRACALLSRGSRVRLTACDEGKPWNASREIFAHLADKIASEEEPSYSFRAAREIAIYAAARLAPCEGLSERRHADHFAHIQGAHTAEIEEFLGVIERKDRDLETSKERILDVSMSVKRDQPGTRGAAEA